MTVLSKLVGRVAQSRLAIPLKSVTRRLREQYYNAVVLRRLDNKTSPLSVTVDRDTTRRINLIVPEISFGTFYGGYIAKVNLAKRLVSRGHRVRIVIIDQCDIDLGKLTDCVRQYEGVENLFDDVEVAYHFDRSIALLCHPDDVVIATTWWTAFVAHELQQHLSADRFVYMIQEYEPFTFAMGSYFAMAHNSYNLPHYALFSSQLLCDYFENQTIGVFSDQPGWPQSKFPGEQHARPFENAIVAYRQDELRQAASDSTSRPKRVLFYARPEAHATRNMFEIGYAGLNRAIEIGVFDDEPWEFYGIGTSHSDIELAKGQSLKMLGKLGLEEYRQALLRYDIGLSLMYTPHPSLLPLEMAAAGMVVVTNTCLNKTVNEMAAISSNLLASDPNVDGVVKTLSHAVDKVRDNNLPMSRLTPVAWSSNWEHTFSDDLLQQVERWADL